MILIIICFFQIILNAVLFKILLGKVKLFFKHKNNRSQEQEAAQINTKINQHTSSVINTPPTERLENEFTTSTPVIINTKNNLEHTIDIESVQGTFLLNTQSNRSRRRSSRQRRKNGRNIQSESNSSRHISNIDRSFL